MFASSKGFQLASAERDDHIPPLAARVAEMPRARNVAAGVLVRAEACA